MATPRTTADLVGGIIEVLSTIPLDPFIAAANSLVTEICAPEGYDDARLELIERYLSAHFYCLRDPRAWREEAGDVAASYQNAVDLILFTSHYGQMAAMLDTAGGLAALNKDTKTGPGKRTVSVQHAAHNFNGYRRFRR